MDMVYKFRFGILNHILTVMGIARPRCSLKTFKAGHFYQMNC